MTPADIRPSLLELSIAIAGFSGIVVAIQGRSDRGLEEGLYLSALLGGTLFAAALSVLGMVLLASPIEPSTAWRTTNLAHGLCMVWTLAIRTYQVRTGLIELSGQIWFVGAALFAVAAVQFSNAAIFLEAWICVGTLSFYAFFSFGYFVLLLFALDRRNAT
jgi:hypothetical protein